MAGMSTVQQPELVDAVAVDWPTGCSHYEVTWTQYGAWLATADEWCLAP
eukprot:SAG31_NODE_18603_length_630_cov_0.738230_2_plen_48_part_01